MLTVDLSYFWKKKTFVSYLLSILVFLIHISSFAQHDTNGTPITEINQIVSYFFQESITRFAVPMFFILSGATFFRNYSNAAYFSKLKSKFHSLVIPYLIWNTIWLLFNIVCSYTFLSNFFVGRQKFELTFINILKGIFLYECNLPFWFILNLIVFAVLSPIISLLISRKDLAFTSLVCLTLLRMVGIHLPTLIFFDANSLIFYFIGAIIGKHYFEKLSQKANTKTCFCSIAFLCLYFIAKTIHHPDQNSFLKPLFDVAIFSLCTFCLWNTVDLIIDHIEPKPFLSHSFAVYALHANISAIITKLFALAVRKSEILAIPNFIFTLIATLFFISLCCTLTAQYFPKLYSIIMGKRGH